MAIPLLQLEVLLGALALNIEEYSVAATRAKRYSVYSFCRRQEAERRRLFAALSPSTPDMPPPSWTSRMMLAYRRLLVLFKLRRSDERRMLIELHRADRELMDVLRMAADSGSFGPYLFDLTVELGKLILAARDKMEVLRSSRRRLSSAVLVASGDRATSYQRANAAPSPPVDHGYNPLMPGIC